MQSVLIEEPTIAIPQELERVFRTHHSLVFRTAYRITGNAADAEDVLQTVFMRLLRRPNFADTLEKQESYLRRAAINAALDLVRARKPDRTLELVDIPSSHDATGAYELRRALARALSKLPPRSAEAFTLRFLEGFANPEVARMLGISQVLVAVIIHRTRRQLQRELAMYLGERS